MSKRTVDELMDELLALKREYQGVDDKIDKRNPEYQRRLDALILEWTGRKQEAKSA